MLLSDITPIVISDYIAIRRDEGAAPSTINKERNLLSKAFNLAWKQWGWVRENPCQKVPREKEDNIIDRWLTPEDEERLLFHAQGYLNGQLPEIIAFALHTGMREEEILNLIWDNVDLFRKTILVMKTKNKKPKTIPMTPTLYEMLKGKSRVVAMSGYIFHTGAGTKIMARNLLREFYKARERAGIPDFRFHDLRHTAGTRMAQNGITFTPLLMFWVIKISGVP
jgi:integrase